MSNYKNRTEYFISKVEKRSGLAPLNFKMARWLDYHMIRGVEELREDVNKRTLMGVGLGTMNKLRQLAGLPIVEKPHTWKLEAQRLYKLLDKHGIDYVKKTPKKRTT